MQDNIKNTLDYLHSEINRIETMAGTLATVENEHYKQLTNFDHSQLTDIAIEEQGTARQLGTIKQMCLSMSQKLEELNGLMEQDETEGDTVGAENN